MWPGASHRSKCVYLLPWLLLLLLLQLDLVRTSFSPSEVSNTSTTRRTYSDRQRNNIVDAHQLPSSRIHYLHVGRSKVRKGGEQSKKPKYSKMYKLPLKFVSNGKPTNKVYGMKTLKRIKPLGNKNSRIHRLPTSYVSNARPWKVITIDKHKHDLYHYGHKHSALGNSIKI